MKLKMKPNSVIEANLGIQKGGPVHAFFTDTCYKYMDKYVPYDPGHGGDHLRENVDIETTYIQYNMPYASYQYYGIRRDGTRPVINYTTENTGPYWDKQMWSAENIDVIKEVQKYIDTHGGK